MEAGYQIQIVACDAALFRKNLNGLINSEGENKGEKRDGTARNLIHIAIRFHSIFIFC